MGRVRCIIMDRLIKNFLEWVMLTGLRRISWNGCVNGFTGFVCLELLVIAPTFPTLPKPTKEKKKK